jgi:Rrf2 family protein
MGRWHTVIRLALGEDRGGTMISQTAEYALRAVVFLAENGKARWTAQRIAEATKVPPGYLAKVMQNLARAEVVNSQRGVHGGFSLRKSPEEVTVLEVIEAVDPIPRIRSCPLGLEAHRDRLCPLHRRLDEATAIMEESFRRSTLAEMLGRQTFTPPV